MVACHYLRIERQHGAQLNGLQDVIDEMGRDERRIA